MVPRLAAFALLAALDYRRRTGRGQYLDISQYEAAINFLAPAVVDYASSGTVMHAQGNTSNRYAPHGAYRCVDDAEGERWITIAVADDRQWLDLLAVLGASPGDPRFATMIQRLESPEALDDYVQGLTARRDAAELTASLQAVGLPAYPVQNCLDLHSDENLLANEFWPWLEQKDAGPMPYDGLSYRLERSGSHQTAAPSIGQDTDEVLGDLLGMTADDTARLRDTGVIG